ncbi:MAG: adenylosuccinate lyase family protein, partial [Rhodospirillales bacterium]
MAATVTDSALFADQFSTPRMREIFSDENMLQTWLATEATLAKAEAEAGIIPADAAAEIARVADASLYDLSEIKAEMDRTKHPIMPLVGAMAAKCEGSAGEYVHWGATTQDIMDTGTVLQLRDALDEIDAGLAELRTALAGQARAHRDTVMAGRSHGQQALPITFGFKAAVWLAEVRRHIDRVTECRPRVLVGQFSGAVGTLASLGEKGMDVQARMMADLGLSLPEITWHTARDGYAEAASVAALAAGTCGKIAGEVYALQKTEIGELEEPNLEGHVGSSTMPHKRNPATCETIVALSRAAANAAAMAVQGMPHEHERFKIGLQA